LDGKRVGKLSVPGSPVGKVWFGWDCFNVKRGTEKEKRKAFLFAGYCCKCKLD
jgi:hypothetical protein